MACRHCVHLVIPPDADGKSRIRRTRAYQCVAPDPLMLRVPTSISTFHSFKTTFFRRYMEPDEGVNCPAAVATSRSREEVFAEQKLKA